MGRAALRFPSEHCVVMSQLFRCLGVCTHTCCISPHTHTHTHTHTPTLTGGPSDRAVSFGVRVHQDGHPERRSCQFCTTEETEERGNLKLQHQNKAKTQER